jgi:hypothetical protein
VLSAGAEDAAGAAGAGCAVWAKAGAIAVDAMRTAAAAIVLRVFFIVFLPFHLNQYEGRRIELRSRLYQEETVCS